MPFPPPPRFLLIILLIPISLRGYTILVLSLNLPEVPSSLPQFFLSMLWCTGLSSLPPDLWHSSNILFHIDIRWLLSHFSSSLLILLPFLWQWCSHSSIFCLLSLYACPCLLHTASSTIISSFRQYSFYCYWRSTAFIYVHWSWLCCWSGLYGGWALWFCICIEHEKKFQIFY